MGGPPAASTAPTTNLPPPPKDGWKEARSVIEHENTLINHRFTWLILVQAALFTFAAALLTRPAGPSRQNQYAVVACAGIVLSLWMYLQMRNADRAIQDVCQWWKQFEPDNDHPPLQTSADSLLDRLHLASHNLPFAFVFVWAAFLLLTRF
jgi:hypothetical protein